MFADKKKSFARLFAGWFACLAIVCGAVAVPSVACAAPEFTFNYADNQNKDYPTVKGAYRFAQLVKEKTGGRIVVKIYSNAKLGDEKSVVDKLQSGEIDFARVSLSALTPYAEELDVLYLPYLYRDAAHMWRVLNGPVGSELLTKTNGAGIVGLSWYDAGVRSFYMPQELRGLKIRVQESELMADVMRAFGAEPVTMTYGQVYDALKFEKIAGAENNLPSYAAMKHFEVAKYYCRDEHSRIPEMQIASQATLNKLTDEDKNIIFECASLSAAYEREEWAKREKEALAKAKKGGAVIVELTEKERAEFAKAAAGARTHFTDRQKEILTRIDNEG